MADDNKATTLFRVAVIDRGSGMLAGWQNIAVSHAWLGGLPAGSHVEITGKLYRTKGEPEVYITDLTDGLVMLCYEITPLPTPQELGEMIRQRGR